MARFWIVVVIGALATLEDVARHKISNWICVAALLAGLVLQISENGWRGGLAGLLGTFTGALVFLVFYLLGGMGGGDIKLMAGFGAILGAAGILEASLWTAACGGIMAAGCIGFTALRRAWPAKSRAGRDARPALQSIPYAPAIAAGVLLSLVGKS